MKSARWEILATDVEESDTTPGNVPQPKVRAKARATAKAKASTAPGPKNGDGLGKERGWAKVKARLDLWGQRDGCGEYGHRVASCPKWNTFAIEQKEEVEPQEETVHKWPLSIGMSDVWKSSPKLEMTNRFAVLEEENDGKVAHPPGLMGTNVVCAVQNSQKVKRLEVTVDSGAEESVSGLPCCCKRSPLREGVLHQECPHWREDSTEKKWRVVRH